MPVLVDSNRTFEGRFDFGKITLDNVMQYRVVKPDGSRSRIPTRNPADHLEGLLGDPSWYIQPDQIPKPLRPLWRAVEFGNFRKAAGIFRNSDRISDEYQGTVQKLKNLAQYIINQEGRRANNLRKQGNHWEAFQVFREIAYYAQGFNGAELARSAMKELKNQPGVKKELQADRLLQKIKKRVQTAGKQTRQTRNSLDKLIQKFPDTEAAQKAKQLR